MNGLSSEEAQVFLTVIRRNRLVFAGLKSERVPVADDESDITVACDPYLLC
jgi:hypothetical protein